MSNNKHTQVVDFTNAHYDKVTSASTTTVTMSNNKQTAVEWFVKQLRQLAHNPNTHIGMGDIRVTQGHLDQLEEQAKEIEKEQKNNLPIHIHEGISYTHVYIEDGIVHVKPNLKTNGKQ